MVSLSEVVEQPERRRAVVQDAERVLDQEVSDKSGLGGMAVKAAFAMVKALKPGIIPEVIDGLLPDFARALQPILSQRGPGQKPSEVMASKPDAVVQALLGVTDERAKKTTHQTLLKAYQKLRPSAEKQVAAALPRVGALADRHILPLEQAEAKATS
jgi:hypothetical protein